MLTDGCQSLNIEANNKNSIYLSEPVPLFLRFVMGAAGVSVIIAGLLNYEEKPQLSFIDIGIGVGNLVFSLFYDKQINRDLYISWSDEEIIFRLKMFNWPVHIKWSEIDKITQTNYQLCITCHDKSYILKYSDLTYLQRNKMLPILLEYIRNHIDESKRTF